MKLKQMSKEELELLSYTQPFLRKFAIFLDIVMKNIVQK